jgi:carbonic anhydrase
MLALFSNTGTGTQDKSNQGSRAAVTADVASLRAIPPLPGQWLLSGLVYDVATGLGEVVVLPALIRAA